MTSVFARVQSEDLGLHPVLKFSTEVTANGDYIEN